MHEMDIMMGVLDAVNQSASDAGATKVLKISLSVGEMTEVIEDSLVFAFEVLSEGTMCEGAELALNIIHPHSLCLECGKDFDHDRFHMTCPYCGSYELSLRTGRELRIDSIEVDLPDDDDEDGDADTVEGGPSECGQD